MRKYFLCAILVSFGYSVFAADFLITGSNFEIQNGVISAYMPKDLFEMECDKEIERRRLRKAKKKLKKRNRGVKKKQKSRRRVQTWHTNDILNFVTMSSPTNHPTTPPTALPTASINDVETDSPTTTPLEGGTMDASSFQEEEAIIDNLTAKPEINDVQTDIPTKPLEGGTMDASSFQEEEAIINNQTAKPVVEELLASGTESPLAGGEMEADHLNSDYMNTDMLFGGSGGSKKGKKGKKEFIVANDDEEGQWQIVNGEIIQWYNNNLQDEANDDHTLMGFCGSTLCDTADVKALVSGESRKDGDLLVIDMSWNTDEEFEVTCPEVFQDPEIEILACQGSGGAVCTNSTSAGAAPYEAEFAEFDIGLDTEAGNTILVQGHGIHGWTRIRLAVLCVDFLSF